MVCGIEAGGGEVAESADGAAIVAGADSVATILDHPEIMLRCQRHDGVQVKRIAERVRQHNGFGPLGHGGFKLRHIDVISWKLDVDKNGDKPILDDWIDGCG